MVLASPERGGVGVGEGRQAPRTCCPLVPGVSDTQWDDSLDPLGPQTLAQTLLLSQKEALGAGAGGGEDVGAD